MEINTVLKKWRQGYKRITAYSLVFLVLGLALSLLQPQLYRSRSRLLVSMYGNDYYAIDKGNQYFASLLPKVAGSQSFFSDLFSANQQAYGLDASYFGSGSREQMRAWQKTAELRMDAQGILTIDIFHRNPDQARQISLALSNYLISEGSYFQELHEKADIKIIDQPLVSRYPVKPDLVGNGLTSLILGTLIGAARELARDGNRKKKKATVAIKEPKTEYIPVKNLDFLKDNVVVEVREEKSQPSGETAPEPVRFRGNIGNIIN